MRVVRNGSRPLGEGIEGLHGYEGVGQGWGLSGAAHGCGYAVEMSQAMAPWGCCLQSQRAGSETQQLHQPASELPELWWDGAWSDGPHALQARAHDALHVGAELWPSPAAGPVAEATTTMLRSQRPNWSDSNSHSNSHDTDSAAAGSSTDVSSDHNSAQGARRPQGVGTGVGIQRGKAQGPMAGVQRGAPVRVASARGGAGAGMGQRGPGTSRTAAVSGRREPPWSHKVRGTGHGGNFHNVLHNAHTSS